jgi:hypothetical protein
MDIQKKAMLEALEKNLGIVTGACMQVGIARSTHYLWMGNDAEYKTAVEEIENLTLDFAESRLHNKIRDGDTTATIFFLKTKGKKRGYIERVEQEVTGTMDNHLQISIVRTDHRIKKAENEIDLE